MVGRLYKPAVAVTLAGVQASIGVPLPIPLPVPLPEHAIRFRVRRSMSSVPDTCEIEIPGLAPERRAAIGTVWSTLGAAQLELWAGYDGTTSRLFRGDVRELQIPYRSGPVVATADDGGDAIAEAPISVSTVGLTVAQVVDLALLALSTYGGQVVAPHPSVAAVLATGPTAPLIYTAVHVGKARDLLDHAARQLGCRWWIRDGLLYLGARALPTDGLAVLLPRTHWTAEPVEDRDGLVRIETLLDPKLTPGRQVVLKGRTTPWSSEPLRIESGEYAGDFGAASPMTAALTCRRLG